MDRLFKTDDVIIHESTNGYGVLGSPEARLGAKLAIAARRIYAAPEINNRRLYYEKKWEEDMKRGDLEHANDYKNRFTRQARMKTADRLEPPNLTNTAPLSSKNATMSEKEAVRNMLFGKTAERGVAAKKHDPLMPELMRIKTDGDYEASDRVRRMRLVKDYTKFVRHATDSEKAEYEADRKRELAKSGHDIGPDSGLRYTGYGYGPGRPVPHILAKIAAYEDADDEYWAKRPKEKDATIQKWMDAQRKTYGYVPPRDKLSKVADGILNLYSHKLNAEAEGEGKGIKKSSYNRDIHHIRTREYKHQKEQGKNYKQTPAIKWTKDYDRGKWSDEHEGKTPEERNADQKILKKFVANADLDN